MTCHTYSMTLLRWHTGQLMPGMIHGASFLSGSAAGATGVNDKGHTPSNFISITSLSECPERARPYVLPSLPSQAARLVIDYNIVATRPSGLGDVYIFKYIASAPSKPPRIIIVPCSCIYPHAPTVVDSRSEAKLRRLSV